MAVRGAHINFGGRIPPGWRVSADEYNSMCNWLRGMMDESDL